MSDRAQTQTFRALAKLRVPAAAKEPATVIPAVILYGLYHGKYAADLLQVVIVVLALLAILLIGVGHLSVHRSMSKAHQRALGRHREAKQQ